MIRVRAARRRAARHPRNLNNFCLLFDLRVIQAGVIVTPTDDPQELAVELCRDKQRPPALAWS